MNSVALLAVMNFIFFHVPQFYPAYAMIHKLWLIGWDYQIMKLFKDESSKPTASEVHLYRCFDYIRTGISRLTPVFQPVLSGQVGMILIQTFFRLVDYLSMRRGVLLIFRVELISILAQFHLNRFPQK